MNISTYKQQNMHQKIAKQQTKEQAVAFVYCITRSKLAYFFSVDDFQNVTKYVRDNVVEFYGSHLSGRYVKCGDSKAVLTTILEKAKEAGYATEGHIVTANVNNACTLLKTGAGVNTAHSFSLEEKTEKPKAVKPKVEKSETADKVDKPKEKKEVVVKKKQDVEPKLSEKTVGVNKKEVKKEVKKVVKDEPKTSDDSDLDDDLDGDSDGSDDSDLSGDDSTSSIGSVNVDSDSDLDSNSNGGAKKKALPKAAAKKAVPKKKK